MLMRLSGCQVVVFCFYCCIKEELQTACDILLMFVQNDTRHKICELLAELAKLNLAKFAIFINLSQLRDILSVDYSI